MVRTVTKKRIVNKYKKGSKICTRKTITTVDAALDGFRDFRKRWQQIVYLLPDSQPVLPADGKTFLFRKAAFFF